ncbi:MAG: DUF4411 family protein [Candidatus Campbellbacteria bacterium]|nr:DUF4411 family protein [Candidatus Campbellbacteria bacterium]
MKKYLLDTSYILDMLEFYPPKDPRFKFVWEKLEKKIKNKEILVIDKVFEELKKEKEDSESIKELSQKTTKEKLAMGKKFKEQKEQKEENDFIKNLLQRIEPYKEKTHEEDSIGIMKKYDKNADWFRGNKDTIANEKADLPLIAKANKLQSKGLEAIILTDEIMPTTSKDTKRVKLNIPTLAQLFNIKCLQLRHSINIITT